jgi:hypothetical protein
MTKTLLRQIPDAGSRFADRRSAPRFAFVAPVEMVDPITKTRASGQIIEISQHGCFAEVPNPPTIGSVIQLRIQNVGAFETWARVVHNRSGIGLGLRFIDTAPDQARLLTVWLEELQKEAELRALTHSVRR